MFPAVLGTLTTLAQQESQFRFTEHVVWSRSGLLPPSATAQYVGGHFPGELLEVGENERGGVWLHGAKGTQRTPHRLWPRYFLLSALLLTGSQV